MSNPEKTTRDKLPFWTRKKVAVAGGIAAVATSVAGVAASGALGGEKTEPKANIDTVQVDSKLTPLEQMDKEFGYDADVIEATSTPEEVSGLLAIYFSGIVNDTVDNPTNHLDERIGLMSSESGYEGMKGFVQTAVSYLEYARDMVTTHSDETELEAENVKAILVHTLDNYESLPDGRMQMRITTQYSGEDLATGGPLDLVGNVEQWDVEVSPSSITLDDGRVIEIYVVDSIENIPFE